MVLGSFRAHSKGWNGVLTAGVETEDLSTKAFAILTYEIVLLQEPGLRCCFTKLPLHLRQRIAGLYREIRRVIGNSAQA